MTDRKAALEALDRWVRNSAVWPEHYKTAEEDLATIRAALAAPTDAEPDIERLLDNAATASQVRELCRDDNDEETPLREAVRMNVAEPLLRLLRLRPTDAEREECARRLEHWVKVGPYATGAEEDLINAARLLRAAP